jgi:long-chain acyl-CoA synthetase
MLGVSSVPGFWRWAADHPDASAAIDVDGRTWSYGELGDRVDRTSRWLQANGIGPGEPVAIVAGNSVGFLAATLAAAQVGVRYTLVNRHLAPPEIAYIVGDCGARLVITDAALAPVAGALGVPAVSLDAGAGLDVLADVVADQSPGAPDDRSAGSIMLYTSGTSGRPKGVQSTAPTSTPEEAADRAGYVLRRFGIDPAAALGAGVHLVTSPLYHSAPIANATLALHLGHTVIVTPRFDAASSLRLIERHGVTWTHVVPTMMKRWLELPADTRAAIDVSTMRWLIHAAAPCPPAVKRGIIEWFGPIVYEYYSSTEVGGTAITSEEWLAHPGSVGRPWQGADVKILDDDGNAVPPDTVGSIWMRNVRPFVYHNDPDKTAANRRGDYVTVGDLGSLDADGFLYLADRRTDLILSGGVNVYPAEIEAALLAHPGVADAGVVGIPDPDLGEVVYAVVRPIGSGDGLVEALHAHLAAELARFKRPRTIELRDALPRSETGKLLRRVLRDEAQAGPS